MRSSQAWNEGGTDVLLASYERKEIEIVHFLDVYNRTGQPELLSVPGRNWPRPDDGPAAFRVLAWAGDSGPRLRRRLHSCMIRERTTER